MKLRLRTMFVVTAICACFSMWLASRQTMRFPGILAQAVYSQPQRRDIAVTLTVLEATFYAELTKKLAGNQTKSWTSGKNTDLRNKIRFESMAKDGNSSLIMVSAWGNPLLSNDDELKDTLRAAIEVLSDGSGTGVQMKLLNVPKL